MPGKFHGQRNLQISYSPWNHKESHTTEQLHVSACMEAFNTQVSSLCPCLSSPFCTQRAKAEHMGPSQISPKCTRSPRLEQAPSAKTKLGAFQSFYFPSGRKELLMSYLVLSQASCLSKSVQGSGQPGRVGGSAESERESIARRKTASAADEGPRGDLQIC